MLSKQLVPFMPGTRDQFLAFPGLAAQAGISIVALGRCDGTCSSNFIDPD
jgi:hypothetical protein